MLHDPGALKHVPDGEAALVFSGHTHGGQHGLVTFGLAALSTFPVIEGVEIGIPILVLTLEFKFKEGMRAGGEVALPRSGRTRRDPPPESLNDFTTRLALRGGVLTDRRRQRRGSTVGGHVDRANLPRRGKFLLSDREMLRNRCGLARTPVRCAAYPRETARYRG